MAWNGSWMLVFSLQEPCLCAYNPMVEKFLFLIFHKSLHYILVSLWFCFSLHLFSVNLTCTWLVHVTPFISRNCSFHFLCLEWISAAHLSSSLTQTVPAVWRKCPSVCSQGIIILHDCLATQHSAGTVWVKCALVSAI